MRGGPPVGGTFQFGNPGGSPEATRRAFNKRFLLDLAEDWQQHGREVFKRVRREFAGCVFEGLRLAGPAGDEVGAFRRRQDDDRRADRANAKLIDGEPVDAAALPAPDTRAG